MKRMHKKAQMTAFVIVGILIVTLSFMMFSANAEPKVKLVQQKAEQVVHQLQRQPLVGYINLCLEDVTNKAVELLGRNGGYFSPKEFMEGVGVGRPHYALTEYPGLSTEGTNDKPDFPNNNEYPYPKQTITPEGFFDDPKTPYPFGKVILPFLCQVGGPNDVSSAVYANPCPQGSYGEDSIQEALQNYIVTRVGKCIDPEVVKQVTGFTIEAGTPEVQVVIGEKDLTLNAAYPIKLVGASDQDLELADFSKRLPIRLKKVFGFTQDILKKDRIQLHYNLKSQEDQAKSKYHDFALRAVISNPNTENPYEDLIVVQDAASSLKGKPLLFNVARKNRKPVLSWISQTPEERVDIPEGLTDKPIDFVFAYPDDLEGERTIEFTLIGFDPDEDNVMLTYEGWGTKGGKKIKPTKDDPDGKCKRQISHYLTELGEGFEGLQNCMVEQTAEDKETFWDSTTEGPTVRKITHTLKNILPEDGDEPVLYEDFGYHELLFSACDGKLCDAQSISILVLNKENPDEVVGEEPEVLPEE